MPPLSDMYKIIGADQKEYGPITADQLRQWVSEGRVNGQTLVWSETSGNWKPLAAYPELASLLPGTAVPPMPGYPPATAGSDRASALQKVTGPAIALMVTGVLWVLGAIYGLLTRGQGIEMLREALKESGSGAERESLMSLLTGPLSFITAAISILCAAIVFFGGLRMKNLQSYGLAVAASIIAMIPCNCPVCFLGLPIGIWALVVLTKPEVKANFQ